jgi:S1-C subfamily serine protease
MQKLSATRAIIDAQSQAFNSLFRQVKPSVVTIEYNTIVNGSVSNETIFGSGFVYRADGYIITNFHVVQEAPNGLVNVVFYDGNTYTARVVGADRFDDIAVLQIVDNYSKEHLAPLVLANSSRLEVGQVVIAIGSPVGPGGQYTETMTHGIISQLGRLEPDIFMEFDIPDIIQTDTTINHGNSGGPLVDSRGEVVGINAYGGINLTGINFAIPSNLITRAASQIVQTGKYDNPWLGLSAAGSLTPSSAQRLGFPRDFKGIVVLQVAPGGPMDKAGVLGYQSNGNSADIITAVDGRQVKDLDGLDAYIAEHVSVGQPVTLTVDRNGQKLDLKVVIQARPFQ